MLYNVVMLYKYPRTPHLPFSKGVGDDDLVMKDTSSLENARELVWTEKMDGENITVYPDGTFHSRSLDAPHKLYHSYLQGVIIPKIVTKMKAYTMGKDLRVCGEYMYARHAIPYDDLADFFLVHSIWNGDICLSYWMTKHLCEAWGLKMVPRLCINPWNNVTIKSLVDNTDKGTREGFVVRNSEAFEYKDFQKNVAKYVRANRPITPPNWDGREHNKLWKKNIDKS